MFLKIKNSEKSLPRNGKRRVLVWGFTLVEVMIVIAIIVLLAATILVNLNVARTKALNASALSSVNSAAAAVYSCIVMNRELTETSFSSPKDWEPTGSFNVGSLPQPNTTICGKTATWPTLPTDWKITHVFWNVENQDYWIRACSSTNMATDCINSYSSSSGKKIDCYYNTPTNGRLESGSQTVFGSKAQACETRGFE